MAPQSFAGRRMLESEQLSLEGGNAGAHGRALKQFPTGVTAPTFPAVTNGDVCQVSQARFPGIAQGCQQAVGCCVL